MTDIRAALEAFLRPWDSMSDEYLRSDEAAVEFGVETVGRVIDGRAALAEASPEPFAAGADAHAVTYQQGWEAGHAAASPERIAGRDV